MSTPEQIGHENNAFVAQSLTVEARPNEALATLSKIEFQVLLDGESSGAKTMRDLALGIFASGLIGLIGLLATIDWDAAFKVARKGPFTWTLVLAVIVAGSLVGTIISHNIYV